MKILLKQFKILAMAFVLTFSIGAFAQKEVKIRNVFLRVYNLDGKKISKGSIIFINDSILGLKSNSKMTRISMKDIGFIKTKRSAGNNVFIGAASGAVVGGVIGAAAVNSTRDLFFGYYTSAEGTLSFAVLGALGGGAIGGLSFLLKESETYIISASEANWKSFQKIIKKKQKR